MERGNHDADFTLIARHPARLPLNLSQRRGRLLLNGGSEPFDGLVPLRRSTGEIVPGFLDGAWRDVIEGFPADTRARDHAGLLQYMQMFGNTLAREIEPAGELDDRVLLSVAETRYKLEAGDIAKSCKDGGRSDGFAKIRHGRRCVWPGCPSPQCLNAALPVALILETARTPIR